MKSPPSEVEALVAEIARLKTAGDALAEAAHRVSATYDGVHRLRLALAGWYTALADEFGRGTHLGVSERVAAGGAAE